MCISILIKVLLELPFPNYFSFLFSFFRYSCFFPRSVTVQAINFNSWVQFNFHGFWESHDSWNRHQIYHHYQREMLSKNLNLKQSAFDTYPKNCRHGRWKTLTERENERSASLQTILHRYSGNWIRIYQARLYRPTKKKKISLTKCQPPKTFMSVTHVGADSASMAPPVPHNSRWLGRVTSSLRRQEFTQGDSRDHAMHSRWVNCWIMMTPRPHASRLHAGFASHCEE